MSIDTRRIRIKRGVGAPTVPASEDHTDGTWLATDIYIGEKYLDTSSGIFYGRNASGIIAELTSEVGNNVNATCKNTTGVTITKGSLVYVNGATGQLPTIALAKADVEATSFDIGIAAFDIPHNTNVDNNVIIIGVINNVNTGGFVEGGAVYLSASVAGAYTQTAPTSPNFSQSVGICLYAHASNGKMLVRTEVPLATNTTLSTSNKLSPTSGAIKTNLDLKAPIASPTLTGVPLSTTAAVDTNTTQIATTAYVIGQSYLKSATAASTYQPLDADLTAIAALTTDSFGRDLLTKTTAASIRSYIGAGTGSGDALVANPLSQFASTTSAQLAGVLSDETGTDKVVFSASPSLTGTPTAPTATLGTNTTQLATTAFVQSAVDVWVPPSVNLGDGSTVGVTIFLNDDNIGKFYSFDGAADDVISFDWDLSNNGVAYDGSNLAIELFGRISTNGAASDTVGWILEYKLRASGDNLVTGGTVVAQQNVDVSAKLANIGFATQLGTMTGVVGKTHLFVTLTRNATGAGSDVYAGDWEGMGIKLMKV